MCVCVTSSKPAILHANVTIRLTSFALGYHWHLLLVGNEQEESNLTREMMIANQVTPAQVDDVF